MSKSGSDFQGYEMAKDDSGYWISTPAELRRAADEAAEAANNYKKMSPAERQAEMEKLHEKIAALRGEKKNEGAAAAESKVECIE
jgi:acyl-CoA reductase-like NAD-dependent aldehyde dehydrogenase